MAFDFDKWVERIYTEEDFGRGVATSLSGTIGLAVYLLTDDAIVAIFATLIMFPLTRITAAALHRRGAEQAAASDKAKQFEDVYGRLSDEERRVIAGYIEAGGTVMTWGQVNRSDLSRAAIETLIQRELMWSTVTADGMTEAFAISTDIFDVARNIGGLERKIAEQR